MDEFVRCIGCGKEDLPERMLMTEGGHAHDNPDCASAWRDRNPGQVLPLATSRGEVAMVEVSE